MKYKFVKNLFFVVIVCGSIELCACKNHTHSPTDKKYKPQVALATTAKYYYTIHSESHTSFEVKGQKKENGNTASIGMIYEVLPPDSNGNTAIKVSFDKFHVTLSGANGEKEADANDSLAFNNPMASMLGCIKNASFRILVNKNKKIESVIGYQEMINAIVAKAHITSEAEKQQVQKQVAEFAGEGLVKGSIEQGMGLFPDTAVYVGDSWQKKVSHTTGMKVNMLTTYTLASVDNGNIANIDADAVLDNNNDGNEQSIMGYTINSDLKGEQKASYSVNLENGLLQQASITTKMKGNMLVMGTSVPVEIVSKKNISVRKL
jgi:hypothetical protein